LPSWGASEWFKGEEKEGRIEDDELGNERVGKEFFTAFGLFSF